MRWPTIPPLVLRNTHQLSSRMWKAMKRRQVRRALQVISELNGGSFYLPSNYGATRGSQLVHKARTALEELQRHMRADTWGR